MIPYELVRVTYIGTTSSSPAKINLFEPRFESYEAWDMAR